MHCKLHSAIYMSAHDLKQRYRLVSHDAAKYAIWIKFLTVKITE